MIKSAITVSRYLIYGNCRSAHLHLSQIIKNKTYVPLFRKPLHSFQNYFPVGNFINQTIMHKFPNFKRFSMILIIANEFKKTPKVLKDNSVSVIKSCVEQFEFVIAYRIRRGQQILNLYTKLWDEMALKQFFQQIKRLVFKRGKEFLLGVSAVTYDWNNDRISEEDLRSHADELDLCRYLRDRLNEKQVCLCEEKPCLHDNISQDATCWSPFIKLTDLIVWKKEEENHKGLYCYKMYGKYPDVTAKDFLTVFLDTENRTKWDQHVVKLKVIDSEPSTNSDVIYWETKWPKLFNNRDYVFTRRYLIDDKEKVMIIMNRTTQHPDYPVQPSKSRVTEYWSYMVIRPILGEFNKPGIEFCLTYFDNPGMSVPSAISSWASATAMPEYIKRLRIEALKIFEQRKIEEENIPPVDDTPVPSKVPIEKDKEDVLESENLKKPKEDEPISRGAGDEEDDICGEDESSSRTRRDLGKPKDEEPPPPGGDTGCEEDGPSENRSPVCTSSEKKEDKFEPFLLWTSFMGKLGAKGRRNKVNLDS
ncbi:hypothetical protein O3M35_006742 [Rhynocoris fuscipes]|uniref:Phosphatidylcholine transfer protein n=1 Tax=Rhynocoris fuscipes TaxID=488301 RepID=A0AAW1DM69_9HEMI